MCSHAVAQQFAVIQDKDGFVNVRKTASAGKNITDTLTNGKGVFCLEQAGNWVNVFYVKNGETSDGFIYKDRLRYLSALDSIPLVKQSADVALFQKGALEVTITTGPFDSKKSKLTYQNGENSRYLSRIDGKPIWGTDGEMPARTYVSIQIRHGSESFVLPGSYIQNLFQPALHQTNVYADSRSQTVYITAWNSDGAGGYVVLWAIRQQQVVDYQVLNPF
jgi:hypothetical protein